MGVKLVTGLGDVKSPFNPLGTITTTRDTITGKTVTTDASTKTPLSIQPQGRAPTATGPVIGTLVPYSLISDMSLAAPYNTLFNAFDFQVSPVYNFWLPDEATNDHEARGTRELTDIPRYVRLSWRTAPEVRETLAIPASPLFREAPPLLTNASVATINGIAFSLERANDFALGASLAANAELSPGIISAVVELPNTSPTPVLLSEDAFLADATMAGLAINELQSNITSPDSPVIGLVATTAAASSASSPHLKTFAGSFMVSSTNQKLSIIGAAASSPTISLTAKTSVVVEPLPTNHVKLLSAGLLATTPTKSTPALSINFVDPAIAGAFSKERINTISAPEHAENTIALAGIMPIMEAISTNMPDGRNASVITSQPAPPSIPPREYTGYVIQKYRRDPDGVFRLMEEINVPGRGTSEYVDSKVVYGGVYRYRIKSILRWTRQGQAGGLAINSNVSSYFASEWSRNWAYAAVMDNVPPPPPDEVRLYPDSSSRTVTVTWKMPYNPQRDIMSFRLFRRVVADDHTAATDWIQVGPDFVAGNGIYVDSGLEYAQDVGRAYVYAMQCISRHSEESPFSVQLQTRMNKNYKYLGEYSIVQVSEEGVLRAHHGSFAVKPPTTIPPELQLRHAGAVFKGRLSSTQQRYGSSLYVARVESLDTGEVRDITLSMSLNDVRPRVIETLETVSGQSTAPLTSTQALAPGVTLATFVPPRNEAPSLASVLPARPASSRVL